jgi:hypothetical protein
MTPAINKVAKEPVRLRSVLLWGLLNLILLGLGVSGYPLWSHHPAPKESICCFELICGQVILSGLLFPYLAPTVWTLVANVMLLVPFAELAGIMSNLSQAQMLRGFACVALWLAGLGFWRFLLAARGQLIAICLATLFTVGGVVFDYLRWETVANSGVSELFAPLSFLPKLVQNTQNGDSGCWMEAALPLLSAALFTFICFVTPLDTKKNPSP